ncbi:putative DNA-binding protein (UPF0251 family) [Desulfobotulus alkaliphilus]|uniref:UPF0251 protein LZ24_02731 n=1 Tax=Desulfobotulus alkaliphilus TaxID=622671 RepID=A0A562RFH2_9BACT|nr:DUF134 domain-containing protein [Desulfobotulus alkaliphilus]TWI67802.1 putative DNA-binding protein (UPF0251 family) [Desulfobotulus alkaliphilus]
MVRPKKNRIVSAHPEVSYFKPRGIPLRDLDEVILTVDEREALRLADLEDLNHADAGERMEVSRATFGRILQKARNTVADALIHGKAIRVEGGVYTLRKASHFLCLGCQRAFEHPLEEEHPEHCPRCTHPEIKARES